MGGAALEEFRRGLADMVRRTRSGGQGPADLGPEAAAVLLAALLDGLLLHRLVDPDLDLQGALHALEALFAPGTRGPGRRQASDRRSGSPERKGR